MIQDLHSHTYYSFCGKDTPEQVVETAIAGGVELLGISDHNYGIGFGRTELLYSRQKENNDYGRMLVHYFDHINLVKEKYADKIRVLRGIELATVRNEEYPKIALPPEADVSFFDYCLIEHLDSPDSITEGDPFAFAKRCGCPMVGVAHTDLFAHIARLNLDPLDYFKRMADENIFWEMNVSYDSIHNYREHAYMLRFFDDPAQQELVQRSGVRVSVGFDGHRVEDYLPERVADYCRRLSEMGIKKPFEL